MKYNIRYSKPSVSVIIAHYKEDLSWVDNYFPEEFKIYIYSKSDQKPNVKREFKHKILENVGRCDHTYLYHIINNYENLSDFNIFITGSANSISHKSKCLNSIMEKYEGKDLYPTWDVNGKYILGMRSFEMKSEKWCATDKSNDTSCKLIKSKFKNLGHFMDEVIKLGNIRKLIWWGVFSVKKENIQKNDINFYKNVITHLEEGDNLENGHYMERLWGLILSKT